jgi:hypothetical protein
MFLDDCDTHALKCFVFGIFIGLAIARFVIYPLFYERR